MNDKPERPGSMDAFINSRRENRVFGDADKVTQFPRQPIFAGPDATNFAQSLHLPILPRQWLDQHRLLRKNTAFQLNGDGGIGKTELTLQAMVGMCATGTMFNLPVERGPCLFVSFEEPENEVRWRIDHLCHAFDIPSVMVKNLFILDLTRERDPWLFKEKDRQLITTPVWDWLQKQFASIKPMFVGMDNKPRFFGGNQIDAVQGITYAHHIEMACIDHDTTIMPLAHVSLTQLGTGRGDSGTVATGNGFRSRLFFDHADKDRKPDAEDTGERKLTVMKANASPTGYSLDFKWDKGLEYFKCLYEPPKADDSIGKPDKRERVFAKLLSERIKEGRPVSASEASKNYAPKIFFANKAGREGLSLRELEEGMNGLFSNGRLKQVEYKVSGHVKLKLDFNL